MHRMIDAEKKRKDYAFQRQFNEKPSIIVAQVPQMEERVLAIWTVFT